LSATLAVPEPAPTPHLTGANRPPAVVLVGNPNVGKSALFGAVTGTYVTVSNYPGTTVEITTGHATLAGRKTALIDTPGVASLLPASEDERVTRDILLSERRQTVVLVGDAKNLERSLTLGLQLAEMGLPFVVCLNMMDEATTRGIELQVEILGELLGVPVVPTVAVRHEGIRDLLNAVERPQRSPVAVAYPPDVERAIAAIEPRMPDSPLSRRSLAVMALAGDAELLDWLRARIDPADFGRLQAERQALEEGSAEPLAYRVGLARQEHATRLSAAVTTRRLEPAHRPRRVARALERAATHPRWGLLMLGATLYLAYQFVGVFGAGTLVELLEERLFGEHLNPLAIRAAEAWLPWAGLRDFLVGPYGLVTMALTYSLALVLPIVGTFFVAFGVLEDSGYLPRLAVMANRGFRAMGLNGKAVLPMVLGLGCDTMATLTTRILETPKERLMVILLLALGVPCASQLSVSLVLLGPLSPAAFLIWAGVVTGVIFLVGRVASRLLPGRGSDFVLELPPMRMPRPGNIAVKTLARIEWYLKEAVPLFILGTLILFFADRMGMLESIERAAEPFLATLLGLPRETAEAFVVGFLRRDFGAAGLYRLVQQGRLDATQIVVATVTMTLFIPCIANFFMIVKERGWRTGLGIAAFIFPFAIAAGALVNLVLRLVPVRLQ
jgi:ferrous iron transport protein B